MVCVDARCRWLARERCELREPSACALVSTVVSVCLLVCRRLGGDGCGRGAMQPVPKTRSQQSAKSRCEMHSRATVLVPVRRSSRKCAVGRCHCPHTCPHSAPSTLTQHSMQRLVWGAGVGLPNQTRCPETSLRGGTPTCATRMTDRQHSRVPSADVCRALIINFRWPPILTHCMAGIPKIRNWRMAEPVLGADRRALVVMLPRYVARGADPSFTCLGSGSRIGTHLQHRHRSRC